MLTKLFLGLNQLSPAIKRGLWRQCYQFLAGRYPMQEWTFMNYGYAPLDNQAARLELLAEDEADRYFIQLYHHVASGVDVAGLDVVEVGAAFEISANADHPERGDGHGHPQARRTLWVVHTGQLPLPAAALVALEPLLAPGAQAIPGDGSAEESLTAYLIVDATGRGSRSPVWLEALGYDRPQEEAVKIGATYTSCVYERSPEQMPGVNALIVAADPENPLGRRAAQPGGQPLDFDCCRLSGRADPAGSGGLARIRARHGNADALRCHQERAAGGRAGSRRAIW